MMCSCNHLTHFAILLSPEQPDNVHKLIQKCIKLFFYYNYTSSEYSTTFNLDLASLLVHFTGVPLGYYSHICTTKVSENV